MITHIEWNFYCLFIKVPCESIVVLIIFSLSDYIMKIMINSLETFRKKGTCCPNGISGNICEQRAPLFERIQFSGEKTEEKFTEIT